MRLAAASVSQPQRGPHVDPAPPPRNKKFQGLLTQETETEEVLLGPSSTSEPGWATVAVWPSMCTVGGSRALIVTLPLSLEC